MDESLQWWRNPKCIYKLLPHGGHWGEMYIAMRFNRKKMRWEYALVHRHGMRVFLLGIISEGAIYPYQP